MHPGVLGVSYFGPVQGSPLIPSNFFIYYLGISAVLTIVVLFFVELKKKKPFSKIIQTIVTSLISVQIFLIACIAIIAAVYLFPTPKVSHTTFSRNAIEIDFDRPVSRSILEKTISPNVPGVWLFDYPVYETHLYRKVIFYPTISPLDEGKTYTVTLNNIENIFRLGFPQKYSFTITTPNSKQPTTAAEKSPTPTPVVAQPQTVLLSVPVALQQHTLSCEVAALRMALGFFHITASEEELLAKVGVDNTPHIGDIWGNPYNAFVGNVNGNQMRDGYGVYWGPIARVANSYMTANSFTNWSVDKLTGAILRQHPVVIWVYSSGGWVTSWKTTDGQNIYAVRDEHSVVAVGFVGPADNPTYIIVNDPLVGQVYWQRSFFDSKWGIFNHSGVVLGE